MNHFTAQIDPRGSLTLSAPTGGDPILRVFDDGTMVAHGQPGTLEQANAALRDWSDAWQGAKAPPATVVSPCYIGDKLVLRHGEGGWTLEAISQAA